MTVTTRTNLYVIRIAALAVLAVMMLAQAPAAAKSGSPVAWVGYQEGLARYKQQKKPLVIFFALSYCFRCKEMKSWVYTDPRVVKMLNRDFVPVMVDIGQDPQAKQDYQVDYIPTHVFLAPDGKQVLREKGVIPTDRYLKMLRYVAGGKYREMDFKTFSSQE